ncbi:MAG: hypothetical protein JNM81_08060 [Rhodospirillaceae bacterium]|nr:hypothetical protein [Rhodospirillaceae bacterium]
MCTNLNRLLPKYEFSEHHGVTVQASPEDAFAAVAMVDLTDSALARGLMALWRIPARLFMDTVPERGMSVKDFIPLAHDAPRELVRGLIGGVKRQDWAAADFMDYAGPGFKLAWSFWVTDIGGGRCRIDTETRVLCCDDATRRWFTLYWFVIRLPSGAIRRDLLRITKQRLTRARAP